MRYNRFFIESPLSLGNITIRDQRLIHQARSVLRLRSGDEIVLADHALNEAHVRLNVVRADAIVGTVISITQNVNEPLRIVTLYCAVLKRENFEWVVQKATEVGVHIIVPIITVRTVKTNLRHERLHAIAQEAAEQSGRGVVPQVQEPMSFAHAVRSAATLSCNLFFDQTNAKHVCEISIDREAGIWVGPEGGWESGERVVAAEAGFTPANLGHLTLRAETAAVVGTYCAVHYAA